MFLGLEYVRSLLTRHYEEVDSARNEAQAESEREYLAFVEETA